MISAPLTSANEQLPVSLNGGRKRYVQRFIASQGFDPSTVREDDLATFFRMLARVDEHEVLHDCDASAGGEKPFPRVDSLSRRTESAVPFIDVRLRELELEGKLKRRETAPPLWPDGKRFALVLTHDVDRIAGVRLMPRLRAIRALPGAPAKRKLLLLLSAAKGLTQSVFPYWQNPEGSLEIWMEEEARHGFQSSFFFFAGHPPVRNWRDAYYRHFDNVVFEDRKRPISTVMRVMADRGWDVGLHGSAASWRDPELLRKERATIESAIGRTVRTTRQHHLLFDVRCTPAFQSRAGFEADSTLGSNATAGFRCGTCYPFKMYDLRADLELNLLEVPLIIQEAAVFKQQGQDESRTYERCRELMQLVASLSGSLALLWHNHWPRTSPQFRIYSALLADAHRLGAWGCSLAQLNDWWRQRTAEL